MLSTKSQFRKQQIVARPTSKGEYRALHKIVAELSLFGELGLYLLARPILWCDNVGATYLNANHHISHAIAKHMEVDSHFV